MKKREKIKLFNHLKHLKPYTTLITYRDDFHDRDIVEFQLKLSFEKNDKNSELYDLIKKALIEEEK